MFTLCVNDKNIYMLVQHDNIPYAWFARTTQTQAKHTHTFFGHTIDTIKKDFHIPCLVLVLAQVNQPWILPVTIATYIFSRKKYWSNIELNIITMALLIYCRSEASPYCFLTCHNSSASVVPLLCDADVFHQVLEANGH